MSDPEPADPIDPNHSSNPTEALPGGFSPGYGDPSADPYDHAVPPGYDWPTHGGYLGCLLGLMAACPLAFVASTFIPPFERDNGVPGLIVWPLTIVVFFAIVFAIGRLGFVLGKRFYREYPQPAPKTWGEDDDYVDPAVAEIAASTGENAESGENGEEEAPSDDVSERAAYLGDV